MQVSIEVEAPLRFLELARERPSLDYLRRLAVHYKERIPWETASRVVRRASVEDQSARPRRPPEFWELAIGQGTGGTCFESNHAFWALLGALGFDCELRINDMPARGSERCHAAVVVRLDGKRYLTDVGYSFPFYEPLPLTSAKKRSVRGAGYAYDILRIAPNRYELRSPVANGLDGLKQMYVLVDEPVDLPAYDARVVEDYGPTGLFLDSVVLFQAWPDRTMSIYSEARGLARFDGEKWRTDLPLEANRESQLAELFGVPADLLRQAFALTAKDSTHPGESSG